MSDTSLLTSLREAIAGSRQDYTRGSISHAILLLAVPMVLEMSMESAFGIVDVFFVSRLGSDAIATVGVTESLITLIFAVALGLSMATTAMVARRVGEGHEEQAAVASVQAILLGVIVALPLGATGALLAPRLLRLMGSPEGVVAIGSGYTAVMLGGNLTIFLLFLINAIFRGAGDASIAMRSLWVANIANMILDPCLIFGWGPFPELGVTGAAVASTIGRGIGVAYQLRRLTAPGGRIRVQRRHLALQAGTMLGLARVSVGGVLQMLIATASWLGLVRILSPFGSAALAGYTIALRIIIVTILPAWGLSNAAATLVGQNLGAGRPDRAERSVWLTAYYNMALLGCVMVVFLVFADHLIRIFSADPQVVSIGASCLRTISYGYILYACGMVMTQAFNGAGDTMTPTVINFFCYWVLQIPLAWALARTAGFGPDGVFAAVTISESALTVVGTLWFRRGRWKTRRI